MANTWDITREVYYSNQSNDLCNNEIVELQQYDVESINDIEEGTLFGALVGKNNMAVIYPYQEFVLGELEHGMTAYSLFDNMDLNSNSFSDYKRVPLIFKKLNDNLAQEILSGKVFAIIANEYEDQKDFNNLEIGFDKFQEYMKRYSDNTNIAIKCTAMESSQNRTISGIFVVDDSFKYLYGRDTIPRRDDILDALDNMDIRAKACFIQACEDYVNTTRDIAETENLFYNLKLAKNKNSR